MSLPSPEIHHRQLRLYQELQNKNLDALLLNPSPSLVYLTGLHFHLSERPVVAWFIPEQPLIIVLPKLEALKVEGLPFPIEAFTYDEDPATWGDVFRQAVHHTRLDRARIGVEPRWLRLLEYNLLHPVLPNAVFEDGSALLAELRMQKDEAEVSLMRQAVHIAQQSLAATLPIIRAGVAERQIAVELTQQLYRLGSDASLPFTPIVSGGPNSANPHAVPTDRPLARGDLLVIDWGACCQGYFSDITRTFAIGDLEPEFARISQLVLEANTAGRNACQPGVPASRVDDAARAVITAAGYGEYFRHRTGHGLGLEVHEDPYIRSDNPQKLLPGMTFTVEPGIYLPGRGGVRIEDNMVITASGSESLTDFPRQVQVLPG